MEENNRQEDDDLTDSQIDLEKIRESRLQRTREAMMVGLFCVLLRGCTGFLTTNMDRNSIAILPIQ